MSGYQPDDEITITYSTLTSAMADAARSGIESEREAIFEKLIAEHKKAWANEMPTQFILGLTDAMDIVRALIGAPSGKDAANVL